MWNFDIFYLNIFFLFRSHGLLPSLGVCHPPYPFTFKSSPLKHPNQIKPNLAGMVLEWSPFKIVTDSPSIHLRQWLLLKLEISLIVFYCFIISQNVLKFNSRYMVMSSLTSIPGFFCVKYFIQLIYTNYAN